MVLLNTGDVYNGVIIDAAGLPADPSTFAAELASSLSLWRAEGRRGLWLRVPIALATHVPIAVAQGFVFHHCQPDFVMLTQWLPTDETNKLPAYASHYVGCAGVVLDEQDRLLVVLEKYADKPGRWKIPGGLADLGEDIVQAAQREVMEETGIAAEYVSVLSFREKHGYLWGCTDLYFVVRMRPVPGATREIKREEQEILECKWMHIDEFCALEGLYPTQSAIGRIVKASLSTPDNVDGIKTDLHREFLPPLPGSDRPMSLFRNGQGLSLPN